MIISCGQQNINPTFVVPLDTMAVHSGTEHKIPPPPSPNRAYYFPFNLIIDSAGQVFFYQEQAMTNDDVQVDWNTPPKFINLKPKDIVQIPINAIEEFIKLNILNIDSSKRYISIASAKDTVNSPGLSKIIKMCMEKDWHIRWKFRIMTQEEATVLDHKKRHENYYPDAIKWDSTKIRMPIKDEGK